MHIMERHEIIAKPSNNSKIEKSCYFCMRNIVMALARLFRTKISNVNISNMPLFLLKKSEKLLQCKSLFHFFQQKCSAKAPLIFQQKISVYLVIKW